METFNIIVIIGVAVGLFLILREVFAWYYKINTRIELQEKQVELLEKILKSINTLEFKFEDDVEKEIKE